MERKASWNSGCVSLSEGTFTQEIFGLCPQEIIEENDPIFVETLAARQLNSLPYEQRPKVVRYSTGIPAFSTVV